MEEIFLPIKEYENLYEISNFGRVKSFHKEILIMCQWKHYKGHMFLYLHRNGIRKKFFVHRLVAEAFIPNVDAKNLVVNHKDENKANNHINNLEWVTGAENTAYYHKMRIEHDNTF